LYALSFRFPGAKRSFRDCPSHSRTPGREILAPCHIFPSALSALSWKEENTGTARAIFFLLLGESIDSTLHAPGDGPSLEVTRTSSPSGWEVELAATETLAEAGQVPKDAAVAIRSRAKIDVARINELESRVEARRHRFSLWLSANRSLMRPPRAGALRPDFE